MPRYTSIVFPIYLSLALLIKSKTSVLFYSIFFFSLQITLMSFWSLGIFGY
jgi:hypothetical protein